MATIGNSNSNNESTGGSPPATLPGPARLLVSFLTRDTDAKLIVDCEHVITSMRGNKAYLALAPYVDDVEAARKDFIAAVGEAKITRIGISARKQVRTILVGKMRDLANYVQVASGGDLPTLRSSGFPVRHPRVHVGQLPAPEKVRAVRGKASGQLIARCARMRQAKAYQWRIASSATPTAWMPAVTTFAASHLFEGLTPLTTYIVQVCAVGRVGPSDWSDAATVTVL